MVNHASYSSALLPAAKIYGAAVALRNLLYDRALLSAARVPIPVISVGNIITGGSGKSPFTQLVAERLTQLGRAPVILLRGYGGYTCSPHVVQSNDSAEAVGDEALMHLQHFGNTVPVIVSRQRVQGAQVVVANRLGDVIVLDDGFQHRRIARDLDLLVVDLSDELKRNAWSRGALLPAGPLRESRKSALERASAVIFLVRGKSQLEHFEQWRSLLSLAGVLPIFRVVMTPRDFVDLVSAEQYELSSMKGMIGNALAAIAFPEPFFAMLRSLGIELTASTGYPDHHLYSEKEWNQIAQSSPGPIFITEKDAVKVKRFVRAPGRVFVMRVGCEFAAKEDRDKFEVLLANSLQHH